MPFLQQTNNAKSTTTGLNNTDDAVTFSVLAGDGSKFPDTSNGRNFRITVWNQSYADPGDDPVMEIMEVTSRTGDSLTATRAVESTSNVLHPGTVNVAVLNTAGYREEIITYITGFTQGSIPFAGADGILTEDNANLIWINNKLGIGTSPSRKIHVKENTALTSTVNYNIRLSHETSETPTTGIGIGVEFEQETSEGNNEIIGTLEAIITDATPTSEDADYIFKLMRDGAAATEKFRIKSDGTLNVGATDNYAALVTDNDDIPNKEYVDKTIGLFADFFFNNTASDIGGIYYDTTNANLGGVESTLSTAGLGSGDDRALVNFATLANNPGLTTLRAGIYDIHFHAEKTAGTRSVVVYAEIYTRTAGGAETLRMTAHTTNPITSRSDFTIHSSLSADIAINSTDRIIIKFYANVGGSGSNATVALYQEGNTTSHITIPSSTDILNDFYVRQDGTKPLTGAWDTGEFAVTLNGGIITPPTTVNASTYTTTGLESILHVTYTATGACTITIDTDEITTEGWSITIKDAGGNASVNQITIDTEGAETIDGQNEIYINEDYDWVTLYSDGTNLFIK